MSKMAPNSPQARKSPALDRVWQQGGNDRLFAIAFPLAAGFLLPAQALLLAIILSGAIVSGRPLAVMQLEIGGFAFLIAVRAVLAWLGERHAVAAAERAKRTLRDGMVAAMLRRGPIWTADRPSGHLAALAVEYAEAMDGYLGRYMPALAQAAILPVAFVLVVAQFDWFVALLFAVTVPLIPVFMALVGWGAEAASRRQATALSRLNGYFADRLRGIVTLKLLGRETTEVEGVRRASLELRDRTMKVLRVAFLSSATLEFFAALGVAGVALYVGLGLLGLLPLQVELLSLQVGLFCLLMAPEVYQPMRTLAAHHHDRAAARTAIEAIEAELGSISVTTTDPAQPAAAATGRAPALDIRQLAVAAPNGRPIITAANLRVAPGERVALVGPSGAGKSTLLEAVAGLREADGAMLLDGMPPATGRVSVGLLSQRPKLFAGTIAQNIRLGRIGADDESLRAAAARARVTDFTAALPAGLDTRIGENGLGLSGGEAQRVALARLYLQAPDLLLLDEPTSHLDPGTEAAVLTGLADFARHRTLLIATHSTAVAAMADRQVRMAQGVLNATATGAGQLGAVA